VSQWHWSMVQQALAVPRILQIQLLQRRRCFFEGWRRFSPAVAGCSSSSLSCSAPAGLLRTSPASRSWGDHVVAAGHRAHRQGQGRHWPDRRGATHRPWRSSGAAAWAHLCRQLQRGMAGSTTPWQMAQDPDVLVGEESNRGNWPGPCSFINDHRPG